MSSLSPPEALVAVAWVAAFSDGVFEAEEEEALLDHLSDYRALRAFSEEDLRQALVKCNGIAQAEGDAVLLKRASDALPAELRATAYYWGADLVFADGEYGAEEARFVERLRVALAVPPDLASRILDVIRLLRGA